MIIVNVNDMNKIVGCIKIMSLLENVELGVPHGTSKNHVIGLLNNANNVKNLDASSKFALVWEGTNKLDVIVEKTSSFLV